MNEIREMIQTLNLRVRELRENASDEALNTELNGIKGTLSEENLIFEDRLELTIMSLIIEEILKERNAITNS